MLPKNRPPTHPGEMLLEDFLKPAVERHWKPSIISAIGSIKDVLRRLAGEIHDHTYRISIIIINCKNAFVSIEPI